MDKAQRDYILRQQLKAIQKELGEDESGEQAEAALLRERLEKADLPDEVRSEAKRELKRLEKLPPAAPDYHVIRTYLDYVLELPWRKSSEDKLDLTEARRILDEDHYGLDDVKERILEFLAVIKLRPDSKSPILCFVGPPGFGKTSLGRSIGRALGRQFERMSLGGVRDEAELRGHRRTYIGSMPGRIIQSIRRAGVNNPVMMLDEIDKLGADYRGDPASALLEILDPQQNNTFRDHYLDLPFDLSKVFFIATANQLGPIPLPLRDRMEVIALTGYNEQEKLQISCRYLVPRQTSENGCEKASSRSPRRRSSCWLRVTLERPVRQLERNVGSVARKVALKIARADAENHHNRCARPPRLPGRAKILSGAGPQGMVLCGVATAWPGLNWVARCFLSKRRCCRVGGLDHYRTTRRSDAGVGARCAIVLWSHATEFDISAEMFKDYGVHRMPPAPCSKDGPSAGVTITAALASFLTPAPGAAGHADDR